jgi:hypothetical protein
VVQGEAGEEDSWRGLIKNRHIDHRYKQDVPAKPVPAKAHER